MELSHFINSSEVYHNLDHFLYEKWMLGHWEESINGIEANSSKTHQSRPINDQMGSRICSQCWRTYYINHKFVPAKFISLMNKSYKWENLSLWTFLLHHFAINPAILIVQSIWWRWIWWIRESYTGTSYRYNLISFTKIKIFMFIVIFKKKLVFFYQDKVIPFFYPFANVLLLILKSFR